MVRKISIIFLALFCLYGQTQNKYKAFLNELKTMYGRELPESFFVIQAYTSLEAFTNAPAIIDRINEIRSSHLSPYIFMVWKDVGGLGNNFYYYLKKNYYIDTSEYLKAYIADEKIFKLLGEVPNSEIYYFHKNNLIKKWDGKYDKLIHDQLPYDIVMFGKSNVLKWENVPPYYHTNTSIFRPINDSLSIELFDGQEDRVRLVNTFTGKVLKVMPLYNIIDYTDVYMKIFKNPYNFSKDEILMNDTFHKRIKRTPLRIENVYAKNLNEIYLLSDASIYAKAPKSFYVPGEYKSPTFEVKQGSITNYSYGIIIKTDTSFKLLDTLFIPSFDIDSFYANNFIVHESEFLKKDTLYYIPGYLYNHFIDKTYEDFYKRNEKTEFVYTFRRNKNILEFVKKEKPVCQYPFKLFYRYETFKFFANKKHIFACIDPFPEIYVDTSQTPITSIIPSTITKKYVFVDEYKTPNKEPYIPFTIVGISPIINGKFLLIIYKLKNKLYYNLYNTNMQLVQNGSINEKIPDIILEKIYYGLAYITDNFIQIPYCDKTGCYNYRIPIIQKNPVNKFYPNNNPWIK
ncbi:MAG: hypothetical protein KatS3mg028_0181 [Bacteroidia bacterium]|nr:MAG: hypothetical protein KatS3mg028_0181 [Bacteroidia bacterium]